MNPDHEATANGFAKSLQAILDNHLLEQARANPSTSPYITIKYGGPPEPESEKERNDLLSRLARGLRDEHHARWGELVHQASLVEVRPVTEPTPPPEAMTWPQWVTFIWELRLKHSKAGGFRGPKGAVLYVSPFIYNCMSHAFDNATSATEDVYVRRSKSGSIIRVLGCTLAIAGEGSVPNPSGEELFMQFEDLT